MRHGMRKRVIEGNVLRTIKGREDSIKADEKFIKAFKWFFLIILHEHFVLEISLFDFGFRWYDRIVSDWIQDNVFVTCFTRRSLQEQNLYFLVCFQNIVLYRNLLFDSTISNYTDHRWANTNIICTAITHTLLSITHVLSCIVSKKN